MTTRRPKNFNISNNFPIGSQTMQHLHLLSQCEPILTSNDITNNYFFCCMDNQTTYHI